MMRWTSSVISNVFVVKGRIPAVGESGTSFEVLLRLLLARRNHFHGDTTTCRTLDHSFLLRPFSRSSLSETIRTAFEFRKLAVRDPGMAELGASFIVYIAATVSWWSQKQTKRTGMSPRKSHIGGACLCAQQAPKKIYESKGSRHNAIMIMMSMMTENIYSRRLVTDPSLDTTDQVGTRHKVRRQGR
jgi:hypothetical protein